ncbi:WG repeat-containing protein [Chryseobacterium sp. SIMBA_028]|uniref:WG repeat-containing protein n=2 Tax=unclassified Chryseobacterium TaxID=2593645 RepID=UPI00397B8BED
MKKTIISILLSFPCLLIFAQKYPELFPVSDKKKGYIGYYLADGTLVVPPQFCSASNNTDGYYLVSKAEHEYDESGRRKEEHISNTEKYGILNRKGEWIIGFDNNYSMIGLTNGFIMVSKNDLSGIVNDKNEILIPIEYEILDPMYSNLIAAKKNGKKGIIDIHNKILVPFRYDEVYSFHLVKSKNQYHALVRVGDQWGMIDENGKYRIELSNTELVTLTDTSVIIQKNGLYGVSDFKLKTIIPAEYSEQLFTGEEIQLLKDDAYYYFSQEGKLLRKEEMK